MCRETSVCVWLEAEQAWTKNESDLLAEKFVARGKGIGVGWRGREGERRVPVIRIIAFLHEAREKCPPSIG